ncbi:MAG: hypothetical protein JW902_07310 [Syntrophaceae bacterium]|nr:hypothetical protein [Syntrophaceae bacterium]
MVTLMVVPVVAIGGLDVAGVRVQLRHDNESTWRDIERLEGDSETNQAATA